MQLGPSFKAGMLLFVVALGLSAAVFYGGAQLVDVDKPAAAADEANGGEVTPGGPVTVTIVAKNSSFDKRSFSAGVGAKITVTLDNQDAGVLHNIAFYTSRAATTPIPDAKTPTNAGPKQDTITFTAPASAGSYFYRCDVHPDTMTGALTVR